MKNLNLIAKDLFSKIRGRFPSITIGDQDGNITNIAEEARFFDFSFQNKESKIGKVSVSLDDENGLTVIYGKDVLENQTENTKSEWYEFLRELRSFAKKRLLNFDIRDITKSNLTKRDYKFLANNRNGEESMAESKMYGTNKTSYQRIGAARLTIKHSAPINTESATGRTQRINAIFVESPTGERFKYPFKHLSGARAMARHVAEGGTTYDDFGKHIAGLSEEISKLGKFNRYMGRSAVMAETLADYTDIVKNRVNTVKKEIQNLQKQSYYTEALSNYVVAVVEDVPDDVRENWIDQLTIKQFNEELADVFPYVYNLVGEATKAKSLGPDDLDEAVAKIACTECDEVSTAAAWKKNNNFCPKCKTSNKGVAETLDEVAGPDKCWDGYKKDGTQPGTGKNKGKRVNKCVPEEAELEQGFEAMMGQFGDDPAQGKFDLKGGKAVHPSWSPFFDGHAPESFRGMAATLYKEFGGKPISKNDIKKLWKSFDHNFTTRLLFKPNFQGVMDSYKLIASGKPPDNWVRPKNEISDDKDTEEDVKEQKTPLSEFILSYFDRGSGQFPKGETAVLTMVEKDYGEEFIEPAKAFIEQVGAKFEQLQMRTQPQQMQAPDTSDYNRMRELAGLR